MFGKLELLALQQYWFVIVSLLGSILVFLFFVQGGQTFLFRIARTESERTILVNVLGRKWEFTFTTLVTFGGAFFASFPLFYATSFGGAYWVWIIILFAFVIQAVSYEFRNKAGNFLGQRTYEAFLFINGLLGTFLVGVARGRAAAEMFDGAVALAVMGTAVAWMVVRTLRGAATLGGLAMFFQALACWSGSSSC